MITVTLTGSLTHLITSFDLNLKPWFGSHLGQFCSTGFSTFPLARDVDINYMTARRYEISLCVLKHVVQRLCTAAMLYGRNNENVLHKKELIFP